MIKINKEIVSNVFNYGLIEIISLLIPIITLPILTRVLGGDVYGEYLLFITILIFGHTIIDYGVQYTGVRQVSKYRHEPLKVKEYYEDFQGIRWFLGTLYLLVTIVYAFLFLSENSFKYIVIFSPFYVFGYILTSSWFFQAIGNTKPYMLASLFARIINLLIIVFLVKENTDITYLYAGSTIPIFLSGVYLNIIIKIKYKTKLFSMCNLKTRLIKGSKVFIGILTPNLYNSLPTIVMGTVYNSKEFAIFIIATRICGIIGILQSVLARSCYSFLSMSNKTYVKKMILANLLISLPIVIPLLGFGGFFLNIFLGEAYSSNIYLSILLVGMVFLGISNSISEGYLLPNGYDKIFRNVSIKVSVISLIVSIILISQYGLLGGAITLTCARFLYLMFFAIEYFKVKTL